MIDFIIFIIFLISLAGVLFILARKVPVLITLPQNGTTGIKKHRVILEVENKIKDFFIAFEKQVYLHKILSWVKIMTLKVETFVDGHLYKIRKKAQQVDKDLKNKK
jgi:hypothetical protein